MTTQERRLIVDALQKSKQYLWDGKDTSTLGFYKRPKKVEGICQCVMILHWEHKISARTKELLTAIIRERLGGVQWLYHWLLFNSVPVSELQDHARLQAHRLAWIDKLIEEFSDG